MQIDLILLDVKIDDDKMMTTTKNEIKTFFQVKIFFFDQKNQIYIFFHDQTHTRKRFLLLIFRYRTTIVTVIIK